MDTFFGTPQSIAAMKRSAALRSLTRADPRFAYYGRLVALSRPVDNTADVLCDLARLQGASACYFFPKTGIGDLFQDLEDRGFSTDRHEHFLGGEAAYAAAKDALSAYSLPEDLSLCRLDENTPDSFVAATVELMEACEVMPVAGSFLRGQQGNGLCLVATGPDGTPVAAVASFFMHPEGGPHARTVFWGMLSTRPDRRGQKIALLLGAQAIVHMWQDKGARAFMTGVRSNNASSTALCNRLGVVDTEWTYAVCIDQETLGRASVTK
ncbi:GNAT family N-acetyltransferase [Roseibium sp.]|uniref:GNAT family N-acetyltransferase n=3 Tax=Roseibium sp. TaxID=1936156 RepID=UPI003D0F0F61